MLYSDLDSSLLNGVNNSYLILGEDTFLMDNALNKILNKSNVKAGDLDFDIFDQENLTYDAFYSSAMQMPFFKDRRIIVVKNIQTINESIKKGINKYLENPNPFATVIFVDTYNAKTFNFLQKYVEVVECKRPTLYECEIFCKEFVKKYNKEIDNNAIQLLCELTNNNLELIKNELIKLCFYAEERIRYNLVDKMVAKTLEYAVYELTNALSKKDSTRAIEILNDMVKRKESNGLIALIISNFRRMFFALINDDEEETANMLNVKTFAVVKSKSLAKNFSPKKLKDINYLLEEIDYKVKSGEMNQINALYYLVFELCK